MQLFLRTFLPFFSLLFHLALADKTYLLKRSPIALGARQSCPTGYKECGTGCVDLTDTCCPDRTGGCPIGAYCSLGDDGEYGCCDIGETCTGDGGVYTSDIIGTATNTIVLTTTTRSRSFVDQTVTSSRTTTTSRATISTELVETTTTRAATTRTTSMSSISADESTSTATTQRSTRTTPAASSASSSAESTLTSAGGSSQTTTWVKWITAGAALVFGTMIWL